MVSDLHLSALTARQLVMPTIPASLPPVFDLGPGPVLHTNPIHIVPVSDEIKPFTLPILAPSPATTFSVVVRPFDLDDGPADVLQPTPTAFPVVEERPFTVQHGPVIVSISVPFSNVRRKDEEAVAPTAASTIATIKEVSSRTEIVRPTSMPENDTAPGVKNNPDDGSYAGWFNQSWEWVKGFPTWDVYGRNHNDDSSDDVPGIDLDRLESTSAWEGWEQSIVYTDGTSEDSVEKTPGTRTYIKSNCHPDNVTYVYLTVLSADGTLARDSRGEKALYYVKTAWYLAYPETLRKALFNDPEGFPGCPEGHCISKLIPDSTIRLQYIKDVHAFRAGWQDGNCGYLDNLHTIRKLSVQLGTFGFLWKGGRPDLRAVNFMTQQMLKTYPELEIGLICGLAVGLVPGTILLYWVLAA
ncbi:hypothetical protein EJ07DRAFT_172736 [Lizonia empirigonia]|nr:hypothetical protein EJ07DRAFT_172736 [Lizonia empirigonia]